jgi:hypothetical protein
MMPPEPAICPALVCHCLRSRATGAKAQDGPWVTLPEHGQGQRLARCGELAAIYRKMMQYLIFFRLSVVIFSFAKIYSQIFANDALHHGRSIKSGHSTMRCL